MGLLDGLSAGLTAASKAMVGQQQGQMQGNQLLRALQMQQLQMDKENAEIGKTKADTAYTQHRNLAPVLGEQAYAKAEGEVAGAKANAETPALMDRAARMAPIEVQKHYDMAVATLPLEMQKMVQEKRLSLANAIATMNQSHAFQHSERLDKQDFERGTQAIGHGYAKDLQASGQAGGYANHIGEEQYKEGGSIIAPIMRTITGHPATPPNPANAPSMQPPPVATPHQQLWDAAVAKHGKDKVLADYGPRPD